MTEKVSTRSHHCRIPLLSDGIVFVTIFSSHLFSIVICVFLMSASQAYFVHVYIMCDTCASVVMYCE